MRPTRLEPAISRSRAEHAIASSTETQWKSWTFYGIRYVLACYVNFNPFLLATGWIVRPNIFLYKYLKGILLSHEVWSQTSFPRPCPLLVNFGKISAPKKRNWTLVGGGCDYFLKINTFRISFFLNFWIEFSAIRNPQISNSTKISVLGQQPSWILELKPSPYISEVKESYS